ncbi:MAG: hypothetical protein AB1603_04925 [Chloroflexota bacterium]
MKKGLSLATMLLLVLLILPACAAPAQTVTATQTVTVAPQPVTPKDVAIELVSVNVDKISDTSADIRVVFKATNPNAFLVTLASINFSLNEETQLFFPVSSMTTEVMDDIATGRAITVEVPFTLAKAGLAAVPWKAMQEGTAKFKCRGNIIAVSEKVAGGGWRQRYDTNTVDETLAK